MIQQRELQVKILPPTISDKESDMTLFALFDFLLKKKEPETIVQPVVKKDENQI